jgi:putative phosphoesterase
MTDLEQLRGFIDTLSLEELEQLREYIDFRESGFIVQSSVRIGLIADLHNDLAGLRRALELFELEDVSYIICAGDIADRGPEGDTILAELRARDALCVAGNLDTGAAQGIEKDRAESKTDRLRLPGPLLSEDSRAYLRSLQGTATLEAAGRCVMVAHGTPWSDVMSVFPDSRQAVLDRIAAVPADVVVLGHTHTPMCVRMDNIWIVNPGSVYGLSPRDSHTCAVLTLPNIAFTVYDLQTGQPVDLPIVNR